MGEIDYGLRTVSWTGQRMGRIEMDLKERDELSSVIFPLGEEIEEYLSYFTEVQGQYLRRWICKGIEDSEENEQFLQARDAKQARSLQSMAYRIKDMVMKHWHGGKMVPRDVYLALNAAVPVAKGNRLWFEKKRIGRRREVPDRVAGMGRVQASISVPAPAPAPAPIETEQAYWERVRAENKARFEADMAKNAQELGQEEMDPKSEKELEIVLSRLEDSAAGSGVSEAAEKAMEKFREYNKNKQSRMFKDSEPTSDYSCLDGIADSEGNGNDE